MYFCIFPHLRGSAIIHGSTDLSSLDSASAMPVECRPRADHEPGPEMQMLLADVIASGCYSNYVWEQDDE